MKSADLCATIYILYICGHNSSVECQLPKLNRRVRFPLSAPRRRKLLIACGDFLFCEKSPFAHFTAPPFRKKSRSAHLLGCKRPHYGSLLLPTFCGDCTSSFKFFIKERESNKEGETVRFRKKQSGGLFLPTGQRAEWRGERSGSDAEIPVVRSMKKASFVY